MTPKAIIMIIYTNGIRRLKISSIVIRSKWSKSHKPKLTLQGDWMQAAGFAIGEKVSIIVSNNQLIITKAND